MPFEARDDHLRDRVEEEPSRFASVAQADRCGLRRRLRRDGEVRELVLLEVAKRDGQICAEPLPGAGVDRGSELLEHAPAEPRVPHLLGVDPREQVAELPGGHLEPLGADERHGHGLAQAADAEQVAEHALERLRVRVARVPPARRPRGDRLAAERLDHRAT